MLIWTHPSAPSTVASPISGRSRDPISTWMSHLPSGGTTQVTCFGSELRATILFTFSEQKVSCWIEFIYFKKKDVGVIVCCSNDQIWGFCVRYAVRQAAWQPLVWFFHYPGLVKYTLSHPIFYPLYVFHNWLSRRCGLLNSNVNFKWVVHVTNIVASIKETMRIMEQWAKTSR